MEYMEKLRKEHEVVLCNFHLHFTNCEHLHFVCIYYTCVYTLHSNTYVTILKELF